MDTHEDPPQNPPSSSLPDQQSALKNSGPLSALQKHLPVAKKSSVSSLEKDDVDIEKRDPGGILTKNLPINQKEATFTVRNLPRLETEEHLEANVANARAILREDAEAEEEPKKSSLKSSLPPPTITISSFGPKRVAELSAAASSSSDTSTPQTPKEKDKDAAPATTNVKFPPDSSTSKSPVRDESELEALPVEQQLLERARRSEWGAVEQILRQFTKESNVMVGNIMDPETKVTMLMMACRDNKLVMAERLLDFDMNINHQDKDGRTALHYAAAHAKEDIVKLLLSKRADPHIEENTKKSLPIHLACSRPNLPPIVTTLLLKHTRNSRLVTDEDGNIPLMLAVDNGSHVLIKDLLEKDPETQVKAKDKANEDTALHIACRNRDIEAIRILCEFQTPLNLQNESGATPLHLSAQEGDEIAVKYFYSMKANANLVDKFDRTPLHLAAERGHTRVVEYLIDKFKCNVLHRDKEGNTLMHVTSMNGFPETTVAFLRRGVPLHMPNKSGAVCLHAATMAGHMSVVASLLEKGANVNARTKSDFTALHIGVQYGHPHVVQTLLGYGADVSVKGGPFEDTPLHIAAGIENGERCTEMLVKSGANVNDINKIGQTALHLAAKKGNLRIVQSLCNAGADPMIFSLDDDSPVHMAVRHCHLEVLKELLNRVIKKRQSRSDAVKLVNWGNKEGETPLHLATELSKTQIHKPFEDTDIVKLLLDFDGDINVPTKLTQETPLHYCARAGNVDILVEIVNKMQHRINIAVNKQAKNGWSPLLFASHKGHKEIVEMFLRNNARVDVFDEHGMSALHLAAENGHSEVVDVLLKHKAFVNAKSKSGLTALHLAAENGHTAMVKTLLKNGSQVDALSMNRRTALHLAAAKGKKSVCEVLLNFRDSPADPNLLDSHGQTPLHLAAENDHSDVVKLFLKINPDMIGRSGQQGMSCGHIAASKGSLAVVKELMRFSKTTITNSVNKANGSTSLHFAAEGGHKKLVKFLLNSGASPLEENSEGMTPFHLAAKNGHVEVLQALGQKMAAKIFSKKTGLTALHVAAQFGQLEAVRELMQHVASNIKSERRKPASGGTTEENKRDKKKEIQENEESGLTPLHLASQNGHEGVVRLLLNSEGVEVMPKSNVMGIIPLHLAAQYGHTEVVSLLLSKNTKQIGERDSRGRSSLHLASGNGHTEMVTLLLGQGADVNARDTRDYTPLHLAVISGFLPVVTVLVESGADTLSETNEMDTALVFAARFNHTEVLSYLIRREHNTLKLLEDDRFLHDLMTCSKTNKNKSLEEFILLSPAPAETAAKLSQKYDILSERVKERAKDMMLVAEHCETMCIDLVALAATERGADRLLKATDSRGMPFLDILIETGQKDVIGHPSVQAYLSDVWRGKLNWSSTQFFVVFLVLFFTPGWMVISLPIWKGYSNAPVIKFITYLCSHIYWFVLFIICGVQMPIALYDRADLMPTVYEWILLVWASGQLVSQLINPLPSSELGFLKILTVGIMALAIFVHLAAFALPSDTRLEALYCRNLLLALCCFTTCVGSLDFLTFHYLFGPWAIIIRAILTDLARFLVIWVLFLMGFSCMLAAIYLPTQDPDQFNETYVEKEVYDIAILLYFSNFGLVNPGDWPTIIYSPSYANTLVNVVFAVYLLVFTIMLVNTLIAMMSETYERIEAQADVEWKFSRAQFIRNMKKTYPTPSPHILIVVSLHFFHIFNRKRRGLSGGDLIDDGTEEEELGFHENQRKSNAGLIQASAPFLLRSTMRIEDVVEWDNVVQKYLEINAAGSEYDDEDREVRTGHRQDHRDNS